MKFSYNWLIDLVDGIDLPASELSSQITVKTAESEGVEEYAPHLVDVCAARVEYCEPIEGSHNTKAIVETGRHGRKTVVCGAPNCRPGVITAYVLCGTKLGGREIRKATISGVESDGMLASGAELGLNRDHAGIIELKLQPGDPIGLAPDQIIEIDNKSLTHRPDLWGHHGMAREVAAILRKPLSDPVKLDLIPDGAAAIDVSIEDFGLCPRYSALVFENVTVGQSPLWLQYRLEAIGLNPINNIVDVTNYIMAEIAQPMHAFDADKLTGGIVVRSAREGERITALDGEPYDLTPANLVIADQAGPIAIAGVIGGLDSAISPATTRIVLESANFQASSIRKTSTALKLRTDASMRFEKAQDPLNTVRGLARAIELLHQVAPGIEVVEGLADAAAPPRPAITIALPLDWLRRKLGRDMSAGEVEEILEALQFGVSVSAPGVLSVSVPSWRSTKDISIKDDLAEEVGRMIGYGSIKPTSPLLPAVVPPANPQRIFLHGLRELVAAQGFHEVYNYSFISDETAAKFQFRAEDQVRVLNPIASDQALMRTSLIPGIWENIIENSRFLDSFRIFEIGHEIHKVAGALPVESNHMAAALFERDGGAEGLFELKRLAECIDPAIRFQPAAARPHEHPARTAEAMLHGETVGRLFEFHPSFVKGRGAVLDLDLDALLRLTKREIRYQPLRRFPSSSFDLSVIADARALVGDIERQLRSLSGELLASIEFVRQYAGPPLPEGSKSISYRIELAAPDRTLSSEEVGAVRARIIEGMNELGYDLRV